MSNTTTSAPSTTTNNNNNNNNKRRVVTFHPNVSCAFIMRIEDYTSSEMSSSWYNEQEMDGIAERCFKLLKRMDKVGQGEVKKKYCIRGLEGHSRLGSVAKTKNRASAIAAVLMEQSIQWIENKVDEHTIADAYRRTTSSCQMWAQVMGKRDQQAAEIIHCREEEDDDYHQTLFSSNANTDATHTDAGAGTNTTTSGTPRPDVTKNKEPPTPSTTKKPTTSSSTSFSSLTGPSSSYSLVPSHKDIYQILLHHHQEVHHHHATTATIQSSCDFFSSLQRNE